jgi:hypothetical protein
MRCALGDPTAVAAAAGVDTGARASCRGAVIGDDTPTDRCCKQHQQHTKHAHAHATAMTGVRESCGDSVLGLTGVDVADGVGGGECNDNEGAVGDVASIPCMTTISTHAHAHTSTRTCRGAAGGDTAIAAGAGDGNVRGGTLGDIAPLCARDLSACNTQRSDARTAFTARTRVVLQAHQRVRPVLAPDATHNVSSTHTHAHAHRLAAVVAWCA